jgi:hypothetical protein
LPTPKLEPYLSDQRVGRVAEKLYEEFPILHDYGTDFATGRIEPPWHGILPNGTTGWTTHPVVQFIVVSDHPRPIQKKMGVRHATTAVIWPAAFEEAEKEQKHLVSGDEASPEERIFRVALAKHLDEMDSLKSIINDAVSNPNGPKSALEAL